ncbi:hypothetical protein OQ252_10315 [Acetobacter farinalis]|uniref:Uncharacterized protein n=1 Tax=Acetobacter farinalis TaxID=1260984 RepID=A0ABT3Q929_9PROT|nr:hypothetical protein [Acetobacter farinalis]MCX2561786.1 hypothetical protein [Acetobacter farinalis]
MPYTPLTVATFCRTPGAALTLSPSPEAGETLTSRLETPDA